MRKYIFAGILYGFSIHWRIYPIIFCIPFYFCIDKKQKKKFYSQNRMLFTVFICVSFFIFTGWSILNFPDYIQQRIIYHIFRIDPIHNYSASFLPTYLGPPLIFKITQQVIQTPSSNFSYLQVQNIISFYKEIDLCISLQTFLFINFNKVFTMQYLLWLEEGILPLERNLIIIEGKNRAGIVLNMLNVLFVLVWWYWAIRLQVMGQNSFFQLFLTFLGMQIANCYIIHRLLKQQLIGRQYNIYVAQKKLKNQ